MRQPLVSRSSRFPSPLIAPTVLFLVSFGVRSGALIFTIGVDTPLSGDMGAYHSRAMSIAQGDWTSWGASRSPILPAFLAASYWALGETPGVGRWTVVVLASLIAPCLYLYLRAISGDTTRLALIGGLAWSFYPPAIVWGTHLLTETPAALLVLAGTLAFVRAARTGSSSTAAFCGVLWALSSLNRPKYLLLPVALLAVQLVLRDRLDLRWSRRQWIFGLALSVLTLAPWTLRNYHTLGGFVPTTSYGGIMISSCNATLGHPAVQAGGYYHDPAIRGAVTERPEREWARTGLRLAVARISEAPHLLFEAVLYRALNFWHFRPNPYRPDWNRNDTVMLVIWSPILVLFLLSLRRSVADWPGLVTIAFAFALTLPFWGAPRFRFPVDPLILARALMFTALTFLTLVSKRRTA